MYIKVLQFEEKRPRKRVSGPRKGLIGCLRACDDEGAGAQDLVAHGLFALNGLLSLRYFSPQAGTEAAGWAYSLVCITMLVCPRYDLQRNETHLLLVFSG